MHMVSTEERVVVDIGMTASKYVDIINSLSGAQDVILLHVATHLERK